MFRNGFFMEIPNCIMHSLDSEVRTTKRFSRFWFLAYKSNFYSNLLA